MKSRTPPRRGARLLAGAAAFAALCGIVLVLASGGAPSASPSAGAPTLQDRVTDALREARRAERALLDANYGQVDEHLRHLDRSLTDILDEIGRE